MNTSYEIRRDADETTWKQIIRDELTREEWTDRDRAAIGRPRRFLTSKRGTFPAGDRAFDQMKRADEIFLSGGGGKNARWSLTSEDKIATARNQVRREAAEAERREERDQELLTLLNDQGLAGSAENLLAVRAAYELGRKSGRRF